MADRMRIPRLTVTEAYVAVNLGEGFDDPPLRLNPDLRWFHLLIIATPVFIAGIVVYQVGWGMR